MNKYMIETKQIVGELLIVIYFIHIIHTGIFLLIQYYKNTYSRTYIKVN